MKTYTIWSDGGARGNPGPAAIGAVINEANDAESLPILLGQVSQYIGSATNNQAEYRALIAGLRWLRSYLETTNDRSKSKVQIYTDSELLAYQLTGKYKVKNQELKPLYDEVVHLLTALPDWEIKPIPREQNQLADRLVNQAIDAALAEAAH